MYNDIAYMYCEHKGSSFIFLNRSLQDSLLLEFVMILIIFFNSEFLMLDDELHPKIIP